MADSFNKKLGGNEKCLDMVDMADMVVLAADAAVDLDMAVDAAGAAVSR